MLMAILSRQAMPTHMIVMLDTTLTVIAAVTKKTSVRRMWMRATVVALSLRLTPVM